MDRDRAAPDDPLSDLLAVVESPDRGRRRLPRLVDRLTESDPAVRIGAAWALCRVVRADPDAVGYVARRLAGRGAAARRLPRADAAGGRRGRARRRRRRCGGHRTRRALGPGNRSGR